MIYYLKILKYINIFYSKCSAPTLRSKIQKYINFDKLNYYLIKISHNGLNLIFKNDDELECYVKFCIYYGNHECLLQVFDNFLYKCYNNKKYLSSYLCDLQFFNNPFAHYFSYKKYLYELTFSTKIDIDTSYQKIEEIEKISLDIGSNLLEYRFYKYPEKFRRNYTTDKSFTTTFDFHNIDTYLDVNLCKATQVNIMKNNPLIANKTININELIQTFINNNLVTCHIKDNINLTYLTDYIRVLKQEKNKLIKLISEYYVNNCYEKNIYEFIMDHYTIFYNKLNNHLTINFINQFIKNIQDIAHCLEVTKFFDPINTKLIFTGNRTSNIVLFEILFNNYIRYDQLYLFNNICFPITQNINNKNNNYDIYQMLMGKGKTSVIIPLITFNYILNKDSKTIIIVTKTHLLNQTFNYFVNNFSVIFHCFNFIQIHLLNNVERCNIDNYPTFINKIYSHRGLA